MTWNWKCGDLDIWQLGKWYMGKLGSLKQFKCLKNEVLFGKIIYQPRLTSCIASASSVYFPVVYQLLCLIDKNMNFKVVLRYLLTFFLEGGRWGFSATICTCQEILCILYAWFFNLKKNKQLDPIIFHYIYIF